VSSQLHTFTKAGVIYLPYFKKGVDAKRVIKNCTFKARQNNTIYEARLFSVVKIKTGHVDENNYSMNCKTPNA